MHKSFIKRGKNILILTILITMLVLECMPAIKMGWLYQKEDGSAGSTYTYHSYFDIAPLGYATFFPLFTSIYTIILIVLYSIKSIKPSILYIVAWIFLGLLLFSGIMHVAFYQNTQTAVSISIFALLCLVFLIEFVFDCVTHFQKEK